MSSPVVFALTRAQAKLLDAVTRPGFKTAGRNLEISSLARRYLVQQVKKDWRLTTPGCVAQELVRVLELHKDERGQA